MNEQRAGAELVYLAAVLADLVSRNFETEDLEIIAAFAVTFADNLALISSKMENSTKKGEGFFPPAFV